ncbi:putative choline sulfate-utilization transcription factor [Peteryoungia aggregata LMG 23059]|uniref:Choline sulfate-utilization transcription factor n=1 Tax=Peteryoungia aggregata LMG 23059 TaxID=1368425 RepID=A0ABU0G9L9_9HYPH|nr:LysR family transcriptional regulator [Peteryoungia aggregata]MDQ0421778.1 putative choline sulfate-utilization transcription factor [Peteryoungia aggregata LMG 23059]
MSEPLVDLAWMRLLVEVGRKGSLSAAAEALGLSQPAVSYQIRLLEQRFGLPLLHRLHRGVRFTEEGRRLLAIAERTVSEVDALQRSLRAARRRPTVRLATDYAFSSLWLIPRMHAFRQSHPDIDLQIVATQRLGHHWREDADLAVAFGIGSEFGTGPRLLMPERVVPVCMPSLAPGLSTGSEMLIQQGPLIHLEAENISPWLDWSSYLSRRQLGGFSPDRSGDLRLNTYALVVQAAMAGQGVALGWLGIIDHLLEANLLVMAGEIVSVPERGYWLVPGSDSEAVQSLASWLIDQAAVSNIERGVK